MATTVYHGCRISNLSKLTRGVAEFPGLYVTDTADRAARYANAQASRVVSADHGLLIEHAAIVTMETEQDVNWRRRDESHTTLDTCEAAIKTWRVVGIELMECGYWNCTCHKDAIAFRAQVQTHV